MLDIVPRLGRPAEVDSDQIETLVENNHRYTTQKIANILKIPKSLKLLVKMKKCVFYYMEKMKQTFFQPKKLKKVLSINFFHYFLSTCSVKCSTPIVFSLRPLIIPPKLE